MTTACIKAENLLCKSHARGWLSSELGVGSSGFRVSTPDSVLQTPDCYCANDIRICTPARVLVMGGEVDILGIVRRWSK